MIFINLILIFTALIKENNKTRLKKTYILISSNIIPSNVLLINHEKLFGSDSNTQIAIKCKKSGHPDHSFVYFILFEANYCLDSSLKTLPVPFHEDF